MAVKDEITQEILMNEPIKKSNMDIIRKNEDQQVHFRFIWGCFNI